MKESNEEKTVMEQQVQRDLRFQLSDEEKQKMANDAAKLSEERNQTKTELDIYGRAKRKEIKDQQKEIDRLLFSHKNGTEIRTVTCTERLDWEAKTVQYFYEGKLMEEREMVDAELQMKLNTNPTLKKVKEKKLTKAQKNPAKNLTPEEQRDAEILEIHRAESGKKTKKSSLDKQH